MNAIAKMLLMAFALIAGSFFTMAQNGGMAMDKNVPQTLCPVKGGAIDKSQYVDADGKRIYVCCPGCLDKVRKNPAQFIKQLESQGITLDKAPTAAVPQTKCPVMGENIDKSQYVDADGKRIYVCCPDCISKVKANPEKYIKEMEDKGITLEKAK